MKKARTLTDPVFGTLIWGDYDSWTAPRALRRSRRPIALEVECDSAREAPTEKQRAAYRNLLERESELLREIEQALFKYYNSVTPIYRDGRDADWVRWNTPDLKKPQDVWRFVESPRFTIPFQPPRGTLISLDANSTWDMEHGLQVTIRNGKVKGVGIQGEDL